MSITRTSSVLDMTLDEKKEIEQLVNVASLRNILVSWTVGIAFLVILSLWLVGLPIVAMSQDILLSAFPNVERIWLWSSFIGVYLVVSTFISLPLLFYIAFVRQGRRQAMNETMAELEHHGWMEELEDDVTRRYNQTSRPPAFIVPLFLATAITLLGWILVFFTNGFNVVISMARDQGISSGLIAIGRAHPVAIGFLGAYFFSIQYLLRRYLSHDLSPGVYMHLFVRSLVVLILAFVYTIVRVGDPSAFDGRQWPADILAVCFVGGVMPNIIWNWLRDFVRKIPGLGEDDGKNEIPLTTLQGLNMWQRARLTEASIENSQNLAMADIVEIMVTTRLGAVRLLDWIDQAMLIIHVVDRNEIDEYRKKGIRSASAFVLSFLGSQAGESKDWNEAKPNSPVLLDDDNTVPKRVIGRLIAITNHPNYHKVQRLRQLSREATEDFGERTAEDLPTNGHQHIESETPIGGKPS